MTRIPATILSVLLLACASPHPAVDVAPDLVSHRRDSVPSIQQLRKGELVDSLKLILQALSVRGTLQCPMLVAVPDPVVTERMPVTRPGRVPWMPVARSECVNPLFQPGRVP